MFFRSVDRMQPGIRATRKSASETQIAGPCASCIEPPAPWVDLDVLISMCGWIKP
jgi:hypothetical protein